LGWTCADEISSQAAIESQKDALQEKVTELEKQLEAAKTAQPVPAEGAPAGPGEKESELQAKLEALQKEKDELDKVSLRRIVRTEFAADPARSDTRTTSPKSIASMQACETVSPT
jgi:DNA repair exonuclease SbcCD ATPase subunit